MQMLERLAIVLPVILLAGCGQANKPIVVNAAPAPVISNQGSEVAGTRTMAVMSGAKLKVQFYTAINPDCTTIPNNSARPVKQPTHGTMTIKTADDFATFVATNPRSACNTRRVSGTLIEYQSAPGFKGTDTLAYDVFTSSGAVAHNSVTINVK
jgi:hypothetical protein